MHACMLSIASPPSNYGNYMVCNMSLTGPSNASCTSTVTVAIQKDPLAAITAIPVATFYKFLTCSSQKNSGTELKSVCLLNSVLFLKCNLLQNKLKVD